MLQFPVFDGCSCPVDVLCLPGRDACVNTRTALSKRRPPRVRIRGTAPATPERGFPSALPVMSPFRSAATLWCTHATGHWDIYCWPICRCAAGLLAVCGREVGVDGGRGSGGCAEHARRCGFVAFFARSEMKRKKPEGRSQKHRQPRNGRDGSEALKWTRSESGLRSHRWRRLAADGLSLSSCSDFHRCCILPTRSLSIL